MAATREWTCDRNDNHKRHLYFRGELSCVCSGEDPRTFHVPVVQNSSHDQFTCSNTTPHIAHLWNGETQHHRCPGVLAKLTSPTENLVEYHSVKVDSISQDSVRAVVSKQAPVRENTRKNYEPAFILFNRRKAYEAERENSVVTFKSDFRERGSGSTNGDDFIAAYDTAIEMAEKRGYDKAIAQVRSSLEAMKE